MSRTASIRTALLLGMILLLLAGGLIVYRTCFRASPVRRVVLVSIDTCRADHLSCYGYPRKTTPNIDTVAAEGVLFENVVTTVPHTLPAHCSMMTGQDPPAIGVWRNGMRLGDAATTLAEILCEEGLTTAAFVSAYPIAARFNIAQGFDTYEDQFGQEGKRANRRQGEDTVALANAWLDQRSDDEEFFLFVHLFDPHTTGGDYISPEPFATDYADTPYAGGVAYADHNVGALIAKLKDLDLYDSTLLIITGDHGEMLGEHGEEQHGIFIYDGAVKVPLIIRTPGGARPHRVDDVAGVVDIMPTICSQLGLPLPAKVQGQDLSDYLADEPHQRAEPRYVYCESRNAQAAYDANLLLGVAGTRWKFIKTTRSELYDLQADPKELNNLIDDNPRQARALETVLDEHLAESIAAGIGESEVDSDARTQASLESLGYFGGNSTSTGTFDTSKDDPKDIIDYHVRWNANRRIDNVEVLQELLIERPGSIVSRLAVGRVLVRLDRFDEAIEHFTEIIQTYNDHEAYVERGLAKALAGDLEAGIADIETACSMLENPSPYWSVYQDHLQRLRRKLKAQSRQAGE